MQLSPAIFFVLILCNKCLRLLSELYNTFIIPYFLCGMIFYAFFCLCYIKYLYLH